MTRSDSVARLAVALAKAQGTIEGAAKASLNPHFGHRYADLAATWDACRSALAANEIAVVQSPSTAGVLVSMTTLLLHGSGEWVESDPLQVEARDAAPQAVGSCLTYLRRYQLASMAGVAPEDQADDDAEAAQGRGPGKGDSGPAKGAQSAAAAPAPVYTELHHPDGYLDWLDTLRTVAMEGTPALHRAWNGSTGANQKHLLAHGADLWATLRAIAARKVA